MNRSENHLEFLKELRDSTVEIRCFQTGFVNSPSYLRIPISTFPHARPIVCCHSPPLPSPQRLLHSISALNQLPTHCFFAKVFTKNEGVSWQTSHRCVQLLNKYFHFKRKTRSLSSGGVTKGGTVFGGRELLPALYTIAPAKVQGPAQLCRSHWWGRLVYRHKASEGHPQSTFPSQASIPTPLLLEGFAPSTFCPMET